MRPTEWEPENDNADPARTDWDKLKALDTPDSMLRKRMLVCRELQQRRIPYVISIWVLPEWLYADPGRGPQAGGRKVPREKWPELAECVGSYLVYAKEQYGVEPDLFSFNEIDYGVRVKFEPEEHRDFIKFLGPYFESLGLKTRMLLADVASCRGTHVFCLPTIHDPEAMRYVGAVAFHSWGGATPEQYGAWRDLARPAGLPLLVTELGVDANWREVPLDTFRYAMREVEHYQDLIRYAQPQGTMQWEFTSDYSLLNLDWNTRETSPKKRFWFVKHFCNLTPTPGVGIVTESGNARVKVSGFRSPDRAQWTLHISNAGAARACTITGLPPQVAEWRAVLTSESESFTDLAPVRAVRGTVRLDLPANSLLTLTAGEQ
jgi:O-glycosyl hydrolase